MLGIYSLHGICPQTSHQHALQCCYQSVTSKSFVQCKTQGSSLKNDLQHLTTPTQLTSASEGATPCYHWHRDLSLIFGFLLWCSMHPLFFLHSVRAVMQASEAFLQRMVALYASSHYKNSPNDLILMSDAPAHHLFALLGPVDETQVWLTHMLIVCSCKFKTDLCPLNLLVLTMVPIIYGMC